MQTETQIETPSWQPIETAPKDGTWVMVVVAGKHSVTGRPYIPLNVYWDGENWNDNNFIGAELPKFTHWMPLPQPPTGKEGA